MPWSAGNGLAPFPFQTELLRHALHCLTGLPTIILLGRVIVKPPRVAYRYSSPCPRQKVHLGL
jgi:hypothetical protein